MMDRGQVPTIGRDLDDRVASFRATAKVVDALYPTRKSTTHADDGDRFDGFISISGFLSM